MARRKSESKQEADKKGAARMKRYEETLENTVDRSTLAEDEKIIEYYGKYGNGDWEKYEYVYKRKKN
jgi:hypothetical protein